MAPTAALLVLVVGCGAVPAGAQFQPEGLTPVPTGGDPLGFGQTADPVLTVTAQFTRPRDGAPARLFIRATIRQNWHIYSITQPPGGPVATKIRVTPSNQFRLIGPFASSPAPERKPEPLFNNLTVESHYGQVTWHAPIELAAGADPAAVRIEGSITAQPCDPNSCLPPQRFPFTAVLGPGVPLPPSGASGGQAEGPAAAGAAAGSGPAAGGPRFDPGQLEPEETVEATSLATALLFAFGGGLILNVMPCVLPVIGLKILSFFSQAGENRTTAFLLNVWYSAGLLSVFLVLAALGVGLSQMFTERLFGIIMASVVFMMALSLMGLWELRVPSFVGSGKAQEMTQREGALGAFFKGIVTTLLAIPCGAPLLSPALKWADEQVRAGGPGHVYLAFGVIGLGMASPYLVLGAFPELLRFLPKPGAWMETFQKTMGYLLLVAVVWILYFLPIEDIVPTVALLFALWLACWLIGRLPLTASPRAKRTAWGVGTAVVAGVAALAFWWLRPAMQTRLEKLAAAEISEGRQDEAVLQRWMALQVERGVSGAAAQLPDLTPPGMPASGGPGNAAGPPAEEAVPPEDQAHLPWQPFNRAVFEQLVAANKTILVDFTADWCLTCKTLEALVLNTRPVKEAVDRNGVVTLQADWTRGAPEVTEMLEILGSKQVPVVAIFPAGNPNRPIVFRGGYTREALLEALERAGPSAGAGASTAASPG